MQLSYTGVVSLPSPGASCPNNASLSGGDGRDGSDRELGFDVTEAEITAGLKRLAAVRIFFFPLN